MRIVLFFLAYGLFYSVNAQCLKVDNGIQLSSYSNKNDLPLLRSTVRSYSIQGGIDYLQRDWFFLSSQVGYSRIGGREKNPFLVRSDYQNITEKKGFISLNTTFRPYIKTRLATVFVGVGPTVSFLTGSDTFKSDLYEGYKFNAVRVGGKVELGILEDIGNFRVGLVGGYLHDISPSVKSEYLSLRSSGFVLSFATGYHLSR